MQPDRQEDVLLKTSIFVNANESELINDLTNRFYSPEPDDIALLKQLERAPATFAALVAANPDPSFVSRLRHLIDERLLVPATLDETGEFVPHRIDIETCRQCNARCQFCPQSISPKSPDVMPRELFDLVLSALDGASPEWVALNHYGEPLLDPFFRTRVEALRARRFPLNLFTNGSLMKETLCDFLSEGGLYGIVFNFPSLDVAEWCELMQLKDRFYWNARRALERMLAASDTMPGGVSISVNATTDNYVTRIERLREHFGKFGPIKVQWENSNARAGAIENSLVHIESPRTEKYFAGCERVVAHLHISWEGKVFLCCQDYDQKVVLGDIRKTSVGEIMSTDLAQRVRSEIFGLTPMNSNLICMQCNKLRTEKFPEQLSVVREPS